MNISEVISNKRHETSGCSHCPFCDDYWVHKSKAHLWHGTEGRRRTEDICIVDNGNRCNQCKELPSSDFVKLTKAQEERVR